MFQLCLIPGDYQMYYCKSAVWSVSRSLEQSLMAAKLELLVLSLILSVNVVNDSPCLLGSEFETELARVLDSEKE